MTESAAKKSARVFFALWPGVDEQIAMAEWQPHLYKLCGGRVTPIEKLHNTLVFLGEVQKERLPDLHLAASEVKAASFHMVWNQAAYWKHNHIVYAAPASMPQELIRLVNGLEQCLLLHQFTFERRAYQPHVTLLRHADCNGGLKREMKQVEWKVRDFALVESVSTGQGVRYDVLAKFELS